MKEKPHQDGQRMQPGRFDPGRREALRKLGIAAATVAAPMILPSRLLAQKTVKSDTPPPSERLSIALVGLGSAMSNHIKALLPNRDIFVHAVCDVDMRQVKAAQVSVMRAYRQDLNEYGKSCMGTQDHREIMARDDIDGVVIATPVHWHGAIALDAIRSGKDVLCESPMTLTMREGQLLRQAAMQQGAIVQCIAPQRCEGQLITLCELIRNGYLGEMKEIHTEMSFLPEPEVVPEQNAPQELDYDRWLGPAPWAPYHSARVASGRVSGWRQYWDYGLRNQGEIGFGRYDLIQWALDREATGPVEFIPEGVDGQTYSSFRYENGPVVLLGHPIENGQDLEFVGTQGSVSASSRGQLKSDPDDIARTKIGAGDLRLPTDDTAESSWIESIKNRTTPVVDEKVGHRSSSICQLNAIAHQLRRKIKWDPVKEEIVGDPIASRMLDRPRRSPYTLV